MAPTVLLDLAAGDVDEVGAGVAQGGSVLAVGEPDGERPVERGAYRLDDRAREARAVARNELSR